MLWKDITKTRVEAPLYTPFRYHPVRFGSSSMGAIRLLESSDGVYCQLSGSLRTRSKLS